MQLNEEVPAARRAAMAVLAQSDTVGIERGLAAADCQAEFVDLRAPEIGLVMLRGRVGGNGAPFNVGEATVTRAAVQLGSGEQGFAYILGRDPKKARLAALCDALWQADKTRERIEQHVLTPLRAALEQQQQQQRARTAATKVDFFTLVRGEDEP
jgi:alpha-D-ribose 1-methylphosphonate 5-triphosphate synthase subunit PhnG